MCLCLCLQHCLQEPGISSMTTASQAAAMLPVQGTITVVKLVSGGVSVHIVPHVSFIRLHFGPRSDRIWPIYGG
jgi:hypothetical protein